MGNTGISRYELYLYLIMSVALTIVPIIIALTAGGGHFQAECERLKPILQQNIVQNDINDTEYIKMFIHTHCHVEYPSNNVTLIKE